MSTAADIRPSIADRIAQHGITMTAQQVPTRPDRQNDDWDKNASHFLVTLTNGKNSLTTFYSMGSGHLARYVLEQVKKRGGLRYPYSQEKPALLERVLSGPRTVWDERTREELIQLYGKGFAPSVADVLNSLASDASLYDEARNLEDFCANLGYDADSRKAEATYNACGKIAKELRHLIGSSKDYEDLICNTERP